jgi:hypothetical protein
MNSLTTSKLRTVPFPQFSESVNELWLVGLWSGGEVEGGLGCGLCRVEAE